MKSWAFFCSDRSLAVCLTEKQFLQRFILGRPQDIVISFVFRMKKVRVWVLLCQEGEGAQDLLLGLGAVTLRLCRLSGAPQKNVESLASLGEL